MVIKMKILISGMAGQMGRNLAALALDGVRGATLVGGVDYAPCDDLGVPCRSSFEDAPTDVDCVIDFSHHSSAPALVKFCTENSLPLVVATTAHTEDERAAIISASDKIPVFYAANYSLGIALLIDFAKKLAAMMPTAEIEIIEKHHNRKIDAPSGTAIAIADAIRTVRTDMTAHCGRAGIGKREPNEIGIHSVRLTNIVGDHEVIVATPNETITLKHEAHDRRLFAEGALAAAQFLTSLPAGATGLYDMTHLV